MSSKRKSRFGGAFWIVWGPVILVALLHVVNWYAKHHPN